MRISVVQFSLVRSFKKIQLYLARADFHKIPSRVRKISLSKIRISLSQIRISMSQIRISISQIRISMNQSKYLVMLIVIWHILIVI